MWTHVLLHSMLGPFSRVPSLMSSGRHRGTIKKAFWQYHGEGVMRCLVLIFVLLFLGISPQLCQIDKKKMSEKFSKAGEQWQLASVPEGAWCESGKHRLIKDQSAQLGLTNIVMTDTSLEFSGQFRLLDTESKAGPYHPSLFFKPSDRKSDEHRHTVALAQLDNALRVEICGSEGSGVAVIRCESTWQGITWGVLTGWRFALQDENLFLVDADHNGAARANDMIMYEGYNYWMPFHRVTCDSKFQYFDMEIADNAVLTAKRIPLENLGDDAAVSREWNLARKAAGVPPGIFAASLQGACKKHADYLKRNKLATHDEDPKLPGYSKEGRLAGLNCNITFNGKEEFTREIMGTIYHRMAGLYPNFSTFMLGGNDYAFLLGYADHPTGPTSSLPYENRPLGHPLINPAPDSAVNFTTQVSESPRHPAETTENSILGYSVGLVLSYFEDGNKESYPKVSLSTLHTVTGSMSQGKTDKVVECHLSYPGFQNVADDPDNCRMMVLTPIRPLAKGVYEVHFKYTQGKRSYDLQWRFEVTSKHK